jgi:hypothetical protein
MANKAAMEKAAAIKAALLLSLPSNGTIGLVQSVKPPVTSLGYYDLATKSYVPPSPAWSSANFTYNPDWGNTLATVSTGLQHLATFFSFVGGGAETVGALVGSQKGTAIGLFGGLADGPLPFVEYGAGLAGLAEGASEGHMFHKFVTNPAESWASINSTRLTVVSDILLGNTRLDLYNDHAEMVIGQPTATSASLMLLGGVNPVGVIDFPIDLYGSFYAEGKLPGAYDLFGITGDKIKIVSDNEFYYNFPSSQNIFPQIYTNRKYDGIYLKFGDKTQYAP